MILKNLAAWSPLALLLLSGTAWANKTVDAPYVEKGEAYAEWKGGILADDDDDVDGTWVQETNFGYGVTDFWNVEIGGAFEHDGADGGNTEFTTLVIDNRFELTQPGEYFVDFGFSVAYGATKDGPDELEAKLLFAKKMGQFTNLANIIVGREIGDDSSDDTGFGFAWGTSYEINESLAIGGEWYSDFGDFSDDFDEQQHQVGPVVYGSIGEHVGYELGVLAGVSDAAPDAEFKGVLNYSFQF